VNRLTQSSLVAVIGIVTATATLNGLFLNFVKPGLRWPLLAASVALLAIGAYGLLADHASDDAHPEHDAKDPLPDPGPEVDGEFRPTGQPGHLVASGHGHTGGPRIGWLLVVPFLLLGVVAPPPLGAFSAQQDSGLLRNVKSAAGLPALPASSGPITLSLSEYSARALYDASKPLRGRTVRLTGFVSGREGGEGWALTRMALSCCAADGYAIKVDVRGGQRLPNNTWLEVVGTWEPTPRSTDPADPGLPVVRIDSMTKVPAPANPYE
jgi:uncharacterized repeat protein (TIGR03943 family)